MRSIINIEDINLAREKGRTKILSLVAEWPDTVGPNTRVEKLKALFDDRVKPIHMAMENFDPDIFRARRLDDDTQRRLLLTAFQAIEEVTAITDTIERVSVDLPQRDMAEQVREQADRYSWDLCQAFYTYVTGGRAGVRSPSNIIGLELHMANRGQFPIDILQNLIMPPRPEDAM